MNLTWYARSPARYYYAFAGYFVGSTWLLLRDHLYLVAVCFLVIAWLAWQLARITEELQRRNGA